MASIQDVLDSLVGQVTAVTTGLPGLVVEVGTDFPPQAALMRMVEQGGVALVTVMDRKMSRNTTRWSPIAIGEAVTPATLVSTVSNQIVAPDGTATITLSGAITLGDAVSCVLTNGAALAQPTAVQTPLWAVTTFAAAGATLGTVATALCNAINADSILSTWVTATVAGGVITLTSMLATPLKLQSLTGNGGEQLTQIGRRAGQFQIVTWASSIAHRNAVGNAISSMAEQMEVFWGAYANGVSFPDGTGGNVTVMNDFLLDDATMSDTYRRDILLTIDYPITTVDALYSVLMPPLMQFQVGFFVQGSPIAPP